MLVNHESVNQLSFQGSGFYHIDNTLRISVGMFCFQLSGCTELDRKPLEHAISLKLLATNESKREQLNYLGSLLCGFALTPLSIYDGYRVWKALVFPSTSVIFTGNCSISCHKNESVKLFDWIL